MSDKIKVGDKVMLKRHLSNQPIWYANYGLTPYEEFEQGMVAEVIKTDIPRVFGPNLADIIKIGFGGKTTYNWGSVAYSKELSLHENELQVVDSNMPVSLGLINFPRMTCEVFKGVLY